MKIAMTSAVIMTVPCPGGRQRVAPSIGEVIEVPDDLGRQLCHQGHAVPAIDDAPVLQRRAGSVPEQRHDTAHASLPLEDDRRHLGGPPRSQNG